MTYVSYAGRRPQATYHIAQRKELRVVTVVHIVLDRDISTVLLVNSSHDCGGGEKTHRNELQKLVVKYLCVPHG